MKVRLQPASRSDLPVYNPILPVSAITQVMLIANPNKVNTFFFYLKWIIIVIFF
jgi:hypothetical protein